MTRQSCGRGPRASGRAAEAPWWSAAGFITGAVLPPAVRQSYAATCSRPPAVIGFTRVILWDVDPTDWSEPGSSVIAQRVLWRMCTPGRSS